MLVFFVFLHYKPTQYQLVISFILYRPGQHGNKAPRRSDTCPDWLQQIWFSGKHSDGGNYPENESRLSDIALGWMVHAAVNLPDENSETRNGIKVDPKYFNLNPDPIGRQHGAREPGYFRGRIQA
jgi:hypothetical protein